MDGYRSLISISVDSASGKSLLQQIMKKLQSIGEIISISSILLEKSREQKILKETLYVVVKMEFSKEEEMSLLEKLSVIEMTASDNATRQRTEILLLTLGEQVQISQKLTLPHPMLFKCSSILNCAAEIEGKYMHPVLNKTLEVLAGEQDQLSTGEFYCQGKAIWC